MSEEDKATLEAAFALTEDEQAALPAWNEARKEADR
jgi:hypothetical protein